jgi:integrase
VIEDHCFWVPLLALFTGMRLNEICQLETADVFVEEETGAWMVQVVKEGEKRVKNKQSQRVIPLHPEIIKVGFPDYVAAARAAGHRRLFPALVPQGSCKTLAAGLSKWFGRYRDSKAVALSGRWMDLHALRHNFATALDQTLEKDSALHRLMGHKGKRTTFDIYTKGLLKVIQAVEVGVSVAHLYRAAQPQRRFSFEASKRQRARRMTRRTAQTAAADA